MEPEYQKHFKFIGRIVGKAIYEQQLLDCYFVKAFYKIILGMPLTYHDVEDYDNELYKNLKWCLENSVRASASSSLRLWNTSERPKKSR